MEAARGKESEKNMAERIEKGEQLAQSPSQGQGDRSAQIIRTSLVGIGANLLLASFKAGVGILSHSIAVILDAVNNLTDALSSVITIIGTALAGRAANREHPFGRGRMEYLSAMLVAALVLYAGLTSLVESVKKIFHPETASYTPVGLLILAAAVLVKLLLGRYFRMRGKLYHSEALSASGADASFDALLSLSVLASALIYLLTKISLEAYVGVLISVMILKSGYEMIRDTLSEILGKRPDPEFSGKIREILTEDPRVFGAYDLLFNNYGPDRNYVSAHLELPDYMNAEEIDVLTRSLQKKVSRETGAFLSAVGVYSHNTKNDEAAEIQKAVEELMLSHEWVLQVHGFYASVKEKRIRLDTVLSFDITAGKALPILYREISSRYPDYRIEITPDLDTAD